MAVFYIILHVPNAFFAFVHDIILSILAVLRLFEYELEWESNVRWFSMKQKKVLTVDNIGVVKMSNKQYVVHWPNKANSVVCFLWKTMWTLDVDKGYCIYAKGPLCGIKDYLFAKT